MVTLKFDIYHRYEKTGRVEIVNGKLIKNEVYTDNPIVKHLCSNSKTAESVLNILQDRVPCQSRCTTEMLEIMGLKEYNVYDILKFNKGVDSDDFIWLKFDGDTVTWDNVKVRG